MSVTTESIRLAAILSEFAAGGWRFCRGTEAAAIACAHDFNNTSRRHRKGRDASSWLRRPWRSFSSGAAPRSPSDPIHSQGVNTTLRTAFSTDLVRMRASGELVHVGSRARSHPSASRTMLDVALSSRRSTKVIRAAAADSKPPGRRHLTGPWRAFPTRWWSERGSVAIALAATLAIGSSAEESGERGRILDYLACRRSLRQILSGGRSPPSECGRTGAQGFRPGRSIGFSLGTGIRPDATRSGARGPSIGSDSVRGRIDDPALVSPASRFRNGGRSRPPRHHRR